MKYLENIFRISLILFLFICGIMIGREIEAKKYRMEKATIAEEELQNKELIEYRVEGVEIYFDSIEKEKIVLIIKNNTGNKLQEVSIMNMKINGQKVESYSCLDGIQNGEVKKCSLKYVEDDLLENTKEQITGDLYIRGSYNYFYQKLNLNLSR